MGFLRTLNMFSNIFCKAYALILSLTLTTVFAFGYIIFLIMTFSLAIWRPSCFFRGGSIWILRYFRILSNMPWGHMLKISTLHQQHFCLSVVYDHVNPLLWRPSCFFKQLHWDFRGLLYLWNILLRHMLKTLIYLFCTFVKTKYLIWLY